jgi:hypothetical protein
MAEVKNICLEALERHCSSGEAGRLDLQRGAFSGQIYVQDYLIVHAQLAGMEGVPALFRLFDWGDAETIWQAGVTTDQPSLHLPMDAASVLYAEHQLDLAELESREKERSDQELMAPETMDGPGGGTSVLKFYTILLECKDKELMPEGFTLTDKNKTSYVIGSSDECDVVLKHPSIDPLHCGVMLEKGSVVICDLGSNSGVKLNGSPVVQDTLKVGDVMILGEVELNVRFQLRRPNMNRPALAPATTGPNTSTMPMPKVGMPMKQVPKGPITYDKVSKQIKDDGKPKAFLSKLGSLFGAKKDK